MTTGECKACDGMGFVRVRLEDLKPLVKPVASRGKPILSEAQGDLEALDRMSRAETDYGRYLSLAQSTLRGRGSELPEDGRTGDFFFLDSDDPEERGFYVLRGEDPGWERIGVPVNPDQRDEEGVVYGRLGVPFEQASPHAAP